MVEDDRKAYALIMVGAPRSGKTTFLRNLGDVMEFRTLSFDGNISHSAQLNGDGECETGPAYQRAYAKYKDQAYAKLESDIKHGSEAGQTIVIDMTHMTRASRAKRIDIIRSSQLEYFILCVDMNTPEHVCIERNQVEKKVPDQVIRDMCSRYEKPGMSEGFDDIVIIDPEKL